MNTAGVWYGMETECPSTKFVFPTENPLSEGAFLFNGAKWTSSQLP